MMANDEMEKAGWDAREKFVSEIIYRMHIFLDCAKDDLKGKAEALEDLFMCVVHYCTEIDKKRTMLSTIEGLLYPPKSKTQEERIRLAKQAPKKISDLYIEIYKDIKNADLLVPSKMTLDPNRAFANYH